VQRARSSERAAAAAAEEERGRGRGRPSCRLRETVDPLFAFADDVPMRFLRVTNRRFDNKLVIPATPALRRARARARA
jgi:hypothetical protein